MNKKFVKTFKELIKIRETTHEEDYIKLNELRENFASFLAFHIEETVEYLNTECTETEFVVLSEFYHTTAEKSQSKEFVETLEKLSEKYPETTKNYNLLFFIDWARSCIKEVINEQRKI